MENEHLSLRLLDTAIKAMERNRTLLFSLNLIAALVFVVVYVERFSFDKKQRDGYLIAFQGHCQDLNKYLAYLPHYSELKAEEKIPLEKCADLDAISSFIITNSNDRLQLEAISKELLKLHLIQNEMHSIRLETANVTPLGFGMQVPRNDMFIICGVLLVILYTWLAFSFDQLARITSKIKLLFPETRRPECTAAQATVSDLVEVNFLFRTSQGGITAFLVKTLYWMAPVSMTVATVNNLYIDTTTSFRDYLNSTLQIPLIAQAILTVILWIIGYIVSRTDRESRVSQVVIVSDKT